MASKVEFPKSLWSPSKSMKQKWPLFTACSLTEESRKWQHIPKGKATQFLIRHFCFLDFVELYTHFSFKFEITVILLQLVAIFFTQIVIAMGMQTITRSARTCTHSIASFQSHTVYVYNNYLSDGLETLHYYSRENFTIIVTAGSVPGNIWQYC